ncbi:MAG: 50S ribosomal protein L6 [Alphaproteobacteria bacterium]
MSRVGKYPVPVPGGVTVSVAAGSVEVSGKLGAMSLPVGDEVEVVVEDARVWVKPRHETKRSRAMWGTTRANIRNMVVGVSEGFTRKLDIVGVGYKAAVQGANLNLSLGYSHDVLYPIPADVQVKCETPTSVTISGASRQRVGQIAAEIRAYRGPEPYKGKGVRYSDEWILRKEGKKK